MSKYMLMWLEAPLQSWGCNSRFGRRETNEFPTKSGLLGLVCCALGAGGEQRELLSEFAPLNVQVIAYEQNPKQGQESYSSPQLQDFQMVGSGYDDKDKWENLMIPKKADGKKPVGSGTKLTYRLYLQGRTFAAVLEIPDHLTDHLTKALTNPVWSIYLGRKCCVPTEQVWQGLYDSIDEACSRADEMARHKELRKLFTVLDGEHRDIGEICSLDDVPLCFGARKRYASRFVTIVREGTGDIANYGAEDLS